MRHIRRAIVAVLWVTLALPLALLNCADRLGDDSH